MQAACGSELERGSTERGAKEAGSQRSVTDNN